MVHEDVYGISANTLSRTVFGYDGDMVSFIIPESIWNANKIKIEALVNTMFNRTTNLSNESAAFVIVEEITRRVYQREPAYTDEELKSLVDGVKRALKLTKRAKGMYRRSRQIV